MTVWALYRVEGDSRQVSGYTFWGVYASREAAEVARVTGMGPWDIREMAVKK